MSYGYGAGVGTFLLVACGFAIFGVWKLVELGIWFFGNLSWG